MSDATPLVEQLLRERDALIARLRTAEERIENYEDALEMVRLKSADFAIKAIAVEALDRDDALASRPHDDGKETK